MPSKSTIVAYIPSWVSEAQINEKLSYYSGDPQKIVGGSFVKIAEVWDVPGLPDPPEMGINFELKAEDFSCQTTSEALDEEQPAFDANHGVVDEDQGAVLEYLETKDYYQIELHHINVYKITFEDDLSERNRDIILNELVNLSFWNKEENAFGLIPATSLRYSLSSNIQSLCQKKRYSNNQIKIKRKDAISDSIKSGYFLIEMPKEYFFSLKNAFVNEMKKTLVSEHEPKLRLRAVSAQKAKKVRTPDNLLSIDKYPKPNDKTPIKLPLFEEFCEKKGIDKGDPNVNKRILAQNWIFQEFRLPQVEKHPREEDEEGLPSTNRPRLD